MKNYYIYYFLSLPCCNVNCTGQKYLLQFEQILFKDLADTIEKTVPVKIYYSEKWVDSLYLNINSENESLNNLFNKSIAKKAFLS